jgi:hypothetical protein
MTKKLKHVGDAIYWLGSAIAIFLLFACPGAFLAYLTGHSRLHRASDAIAMSGVFLSLSLVSLGVGRAFRYILARN